MIVPITPEADLEIVVETQTGIDETGRVTAPVLVNGEGPFRFFVDTGANSSALSDRLAERLGLQVAGEMRVHGLAGAIIAPTAHVGSLESGAIGLGDVRLPILSGGAFGRAAGVLGVEAMADRRLTINFTERSMRIARSSRRAPGQDWRSVRAEFRLGLLVVARGSIDNTPVNVIIDTGADTSFGNQALATALESASTRRVQRFEVVGSAFGPDIIIDQLLFVSRMRMGDMEATSFPVLISDLHIFDVWQLQHEPTILLGMDVLSKTHALAIDYGHARLYFLPRGGGFRR